MQNVTAKKIATIEKNNKKYNSSEPPTFQSQRVGYQLTKNCCITTCNQDISSIHEFILNIWQILEPHELKGHGHF